MHQNILNIVLVWVYHYSVIIAYIYHVTVLKQFHIFRCIESNIKIYSQWVTYSLYDKSAQQFLVLALLCLLRAAGLTRLSMHQIRTCCTARW